MKTASSCLMVLVLSLCAAAASAATSFYVDPDWSGARRGTESEPWTSLWDSGAWSAIGNALAKDDVTIYFSAREAGADTSETTTTPLQISRSDTSYHRLILDGMSKYNTNDAAPIWVDYSGPSRFQITAGIPIVTPTSGKQNYLTIRGFRLIAGTSSQGLYYYGGDHVVIEYVYCYGDVIMFEYAHRSNGGISNGGCEDITIRNCEVDYTTGEGIYFGGSENTSNYGHNNVLIENNIVHDCGKNPNMSGEGDGIDVKDGNTNVVIRGNRVYNNERRGIICCSAATIEKNICYGNGSEGIGYNDFWGKVAHSGCIIRNNIVYNNGQANLSDWQNANITAGHASGGVGITSLSIVNNTCYSGENKNISIVGAASINGLIIQNNIAWNSPSNILVSGTPGGTYQNDHNWTSDPSVMNAVGGDFHLRPGSPCIDAGVTLSGFADDYEGNARPAGAWDIGAFEYSSSPSGPPTVTGLMAYPD